MPLSGVSRTWQCFPTYALCYKKKQFLQINTAKYRWLKVEETRRHAQLTAQAHTVHFPKEKNVLKEYREGK